MLPLHTELLQLVCEYFVRHDNDAIMLFQTCKRWCEIVGNYQVALRCYPRKLDLNNMTLTVASLQWYKSQGGYLRNSKILIKVCVEGKRDCVEYLKSEGIAWNNVAIDAAFSSGNQEFIEWVRADCCQGLVSRSQLEALALAGNLELFEHYVPFDKVASIFTKPSPLLLFINTLIGGNVKMLNWFVQAGIDFKTCSIYTGFLDDFYYYGIKHIPILDWLWEHKFIIKEFALAEAVNKGYLESVEWLLRKGEEFLALTVRDATQDSPLYMLKWMHERGMVLSAAPAARAGRRDILEWLLRLGGQDFSGAVESAARSNQINIIKWLIKRGLGTLDEIRPVIKYAKVFGFLNILQFAIDNNLLTQIELDTF